jgi:CubicO group peptidase (beta-lactamase class C family)
MAPVDPSTIFGIASVSKCFTALAVMQLEDEGRLSVQDPVEKHLPGFRFAGSPVPEARLHHLMNHTSGLPPLRGLSLALKESMKGYPKWDDAEEEKKDDSGTGTGVAPDTGSFAGHLRYLAEEKEPLLGRPGEYFSYSNDSYAVLGAVIEAVTGESYYEFMRRRVFGLAGMEKTAFTVDEARSLGRLSAIYLNNKREETLDVPRYQECGAYDAGGGIKSTVRDLVKFGAALAGDGLPRGARIASAGAIKTMCRPHCQIGRNTFYGYGLQITPDYAGMTLVEHGGSLTGVSSNFGFVPERNLSVALLTNIGGAPSASMWLAAVNAALGMPLDKKRSEEPHFEMGREQLARFAGRYRSGEGADLTVAFDGESLVIRFSGLEFPLRASDESTLVYTMKGQERTARFHFDETGEVWAVFHGLRMIRRVK